MKTITIDGRRYRLALDAHHGQLTVSGPGLLSPAYLPAGVSADAPDLRECCRAAIEQARANAREASEAIQRRVREGTAGLGHAER